MDRYGAGSRCGLRRPGQQAKDLCLTGRPGIATSRVIGGCWRCSPSWTRADRQTPASRNADRLAGGETSVVELRCVIVDDNNLFLQAAQTLLEQDGATVAGVANNCAEAVARTKALRPDVVLIDIRLGEESGFDVARRLADNGQQAALVMISTCATDYADLIAESPVAGFVPKAELSADAIRRILGTD
jgi:CheY-like chemotaxis protein